MMQYPAQSKGYTWTEIKHLVRDRREWKQYSSVAYAPKWSEYSSDQTMNETVRKLRKSHKIVTEVL